MISAKFNQVLNDTATGSTVVIKNASGAVVPLTKFTVSNYTITAFIAPNGQTSTGTARYLHMEDGPFTATWSAVSNTAAAGTGTVVQTFYLDGAAPAVRINSPEAMMSTPQVGPTGTIEPTGMNMTIQGQNVVVLGPQELLVIDGKAIDKVDANGDATFTSGIMKVDAVLTDATALDTDNSSAKSYASKANTCAGTQCPANLVFSEADGGESWDISADVPPGVWSMTIIATDLSGLHGYSAPLTIVKLS